MFGEGISKAYEILDLGVEYNIVQKSGSWFSYDGNKIAQGRDAAKRVIEDNPELAEELEAKIMDALKEAESSRYGKKKAAPLATPSISKDDNLDEIDLDEDLLLEDDDDLV